MKLENLTQTLGETPTLSTGLLGATPYAKLTQEQLQKIEEALGAQTQQNQAQEELQQAQNLVNEALTHFGLTPSPNLEESIATLQELCQTYANSANRHTFAPTDGQDKDPRQDTPQSFVNPNDDLYQNLKKL